MQKNKIKFTLKKIGFFVVVLNLLFLARFCFALETDYPDILGNTIPANAELGDYVSYFVNIGISVSGILAALVIVFGGLQYIIFGAMGKSTSEGKEWVKSGVLGLFLLVSAYIILSTINPALVNPTMGKLLNIIPFVGHISNLNKLPPKMIYKEIPLGTLAELTLSRKISCYTYNELGDPIQKQIKVDSGGLVDGPAYLDHDRVDCMKQLNEAIEKKSKIIKELSTKITALMASCSCKQSTSSSSSSTSTSIVNCIATGVCPDPGVEPADCKGNICGPAIPCDCYDSCEPNSDEFSMCPAGTKKMAKEGPIEIDGLNWIEFSLLLLKDKPNPPLGYTFYMSNLYDCINVSPNISKPKKYKGLQEFDTTLNAQGVINLIDSKVKVEGKDVVIMNTTNWDNLKLIEQLMYLREKLYQMNLTLNQDNRNLASAKVELGRCYLATPYVDYLKKIEQTKKENLVIMTQKNYNQYEQKFTDISKYCNGFGYTNSSCFYNCENACPSYTEQALNCNKNCDKDCDAECPGNTPNCMYLKNNCLTEENICVEDCFTNKKPCPNDSSGNFTNFQGCLESCKTECSEDCDEKFKKCSSVADSCKTCSTNLDPTTNFPGVCDILSNKYCSDEFKKCQNICGNNSQCVLDNKEECIYNPQSLIKCAVIDTDNENKKNCVENSSFTCKYGSSQQAGFTDCLEYPYSLQNIFSSSDIYKGIIDNKDYQKCPNPFIPNINKFCYTANSPTSSCVEVCPEVSKCPSASNCPDCPCTTLPLNPIPSSSDSSSCQTTDPSQANYCTGGKICVAGNCVDNNQNITDYRVVGGECQEYKYNDDPLTFYCRQDWWNEPALKEEQPLANNYVCPKKNEIPVGQAIDDTQIWAQKLINYNVNFIKITDLLINSLKSIDTLNKSDAYCKCGSDCGNGEKACNAPCVPTVKTNLDPSGKPLINPDGSVSKSCICVEQGCKGNPCQLMLNLLKGKSTGASCPKGTPINGPTQFYNQIKKLLDTIDSYSLKSRTEIVKKLIYSRKTMNSCSSESKANTVAEQTRLESCRRVRNNFVSPIAGEEFIINGQKVDYPCYGIDLGSIFGSSFASSGTPVSIPQVPIIPATDNWFCCVPRD
jgi:hypothetical protein